jgi:hypothetical protein
MQSWKKKIFPFLDFSIFAVFAVFKGGIKITNTHKNCVANENQPVTG